MLKNYGVVEINATKEKIVQLMEVNLVADDNKVAFSMFKYYEQCES